MNLADAIERKVLVRALCLARDRKLFKETSDSAILDRLIARAKDANPPHSSQGGNETRLDLVALCECGHKREVHRGRGAHANMGRCNVLGCLCIQFNKRDATQAQRARPPHRQRRQR